MNIEFLELDGAQGEGGGQILRSALTLAMITGRPFRITRIRAGRARPGLLRQHLTAVAAAAEISGATVEGNTPGSQTLSFAPRTDGARIRGGEYRFAIGSAGSATLVLQTVLPALWFADAPASVRVSGGTHNPAAPPADFLARCWLPLMRSMGAQIEIELLRHGFYPAGGGEVQARTAPCALAPLHLTERGALQTLRTEARVAAIPRHVAQRELDAVQARLARGRHAERMALQPAELALTELPAAQGPGNVLLIEAAHEHVCELFCGFGEKGLPAEKLAAATADEARRWLDSGAAVGEHLADQLALPMALAGGGSFTTHVRSNHLDTNLAVIERFLPVKSSVEACDVGFRVCVELG